jgi:cytochrome c biogenesis protein CcdA
MLALIGAFVAGVLTTLAPCVLPMLPVIVGGSIAGVATDPNATGGAAVATARRTGLRRALVITASLGVSIIVFTLALKASTSLIGIPAEAWQWLSGGLLVGLGLVALFPDLWDRLSARLGLQARSTARLSAARDREGLTGEILTGAALGPVFSSCSPLYGYVVVTVLPAEFGYGMLLLLAYVLGLCGTLLAIALLGQRLLRNARWLADPHGWFRRGLGAVFIAVGAAVILGWDKEFQAWVLENSPIAPWELDSGFIPE